ncbi:MAG: 23S rRNA (guanosine(2251)-2'-O)-methyltransferase RlmB [Gammaproteobacteria bacterium]|nr:23S rRNA (guanosine(2251)-2'-O)-methyltransferase RlmB [Gammaproteobacteria bacterium]
MPDTQHPDVDWTFGIHGVQALLDVSPQDVRRLVIADGPRNRQVSQLTATARAAGVRIERVPRQALDRYLKRATSGRSDSGGVVNHQGVAAERHAFAPSTESDLEARWSSFEEPLLVVLEGIEDPRNLGACLRTAEAAGADAVLIPRHGSAPLSTAAAKAASGAMERLFVVEVVNLVRRLGWLQAQGVWISGGVEDEAAMNYTEVDYRGAAAIVVGSEGRGLRRLTRERCDHLVRIPMTSTMPSLNVSVALGVLLFEAVRQRSE